MITRSILKLIVGVMIVARCASAAEMASSPKASDEKSWVLAAKGDVGGSVIRLDLKGASAREAFSALESQSQSRFATKPKSLLDEVSIKADVNIDGKSFWEALDTLCRAYRLAADEEMGAIRLQRSEGDDSAAMTFGRPAVLSGPFLVMADGVDRVHETGYMRGQEARRRCTVHMTIWSEPRLRVLAVLPVVSINLAMDEAGHALQPTDLGGGHVFLFGSVGIQHKAQAMLEMGDGKATKIARLAGKAYVALGKRFERAMIDLSKPGAEAVVAGRRITIKRVEKKQRQGEPARYEVDLTMTIQRRLDAAAPLEQFSVFRLEGGDKTIVSHQAQRPAFGGVESFTWNLEFWDDAEGGKGLGAPLRLAVDLPVEMQLVELPFELRDLVIP